MPWHMHGMFLGEGYMGTLALPYRDKPRNATAPRRRRAFRDINSTVLAIAIKHQGVVEASRCKFLDFFQEVPLPPGSESPSRVNTAASTEYVNTKILQFHR